MHLDPSEVTPLKHLFKVEEGHYGSQICASHIKKLGLGGDKNILFKKRSLSILKHFVDTII